MLSKTLNELPLISAETLVNAHQAAGHKTIVWNGKSRHGRRVASGVYFYRLEAPGYGKTLKMTLVQ